MQVLDAIDPRELDALLARGEFFWLDVVDADAATLTKLGERFGWHPLVVEDTIHFGQRPKLERFDDQILLVFYGARPATDGPELIEVHVIVSGDWVVTVRRERVAELDALHARLRADGRESEQFVVYRVLDALTDTFFPVLEALDDRIDALEDAIVREPDEAQLQEASASSGRSSRCGGPSARSATSPPARSTTSPSCPGWTPARATTSATSTTTSSASRTRSTPTATC
jgi:magnesium transporter